MLLSQTKESIERHNTGIGHNLQHKIAQLVLEMRLVGIEL